MSLERRKLMLTRRFRKHAVMAVAICTMLSLLTLNLSAAARAAEDDLAPFRVLAKEALQLVTAGKMSEAAKKGQEIEDKWDANGLGGPYPDIDEEMDTMNNAIKSGDAKKATTEIRKYLAMLGGGSN
jgi:hypothetical protein